VNRNEIMTMPADELRLAIAKAHGWYGFGFYKSGVLSGLRNDPEYGVLSNAVPEWTTSIADAWVLLNEFPGFTMSKTPDGRALLSVFDGITHIADTDLILAICRAWLMWKTEAE